MTHGQHCFVRLDHALDLDHRCCSCHGTHGSVPCCGCGCGSCCEACLPSVATLRKNERQAPSPILSLSLSLSLYRSFFLSFLSRSPSLSLYDLHTQNGKLASMPSLRCFKSFQNGILSVTAGGRHGEAAVCAPGDFAVGAEVGQVPCCLVLEPSTPKPCQNKEPARCSQHPRFFCASCCQLHKPLRSPRRCFKGTLARGLHQHGRDYTRTNP